MQLAESAVKYEDGLKPEFDLRAMSYNVNYFCPVSEVSLQRTKNSD
jgi:hypothetical protein